MKFIFLSAIVFKSLPSSGDNLEDLSPASHGFLPPSRNHAMTKRSQACFRSPLLTPASCRESGTTAIHPLWPSSLTLQALLSHSAPLLVLMLWWRRQIATWTQIPNHLKTCLLFPTGYHQSGVSGSITHPENSFTRQWFMTASVCVFIKGKSVADYLLLGVGSKPLPWDKRQLLAYHGWDNLFGVWSLHVRHF